MLNKLAKGCYWLIIAVAVVIVAESIYVVTSDSNYAICERIEQDIGRLNADAKSLNDELKKHGFADPEVYPPILDILNAKYKQNNCDDANLW